MGHRRDEWWDYFESCEEAGKETSYDGFREYLYDKADLAIGDE